MPDTAARYVLPCWLLLCVFAGTLAACTPDDAAAPDTPSFVAQTEAAGAPTEAEQDSALTLLQRLQPQAMQEAFEVLEQYDFTRHLRTEQLDGQGQRMAARERTIVYRGRAGNREATVVSQSESGTFSFGWLGRFVSRDETPDPLPRAGANLLSDDPAYLSPRNRDLYHFRLPADTTLAGRRARIAEVQLRPEADDTPGVHHARFYIDPENDQVLAFSITHVNETLLFDEASRFEVELQRQGDDWVPRTSRFRTRIQLPFAPLREFETSSVYSDYRRNVSG